MAEYRPVRSEAENACPVGARAGPEVTKGAVGPILAQHFTHERPGGDYTAQIIKEKTLFDRK